MKNNKTTVSKIFISIASLALLQFSTACGTIATQTADGSNPSANSSLGASDSQIFLFASDYASSGQLYTASLIDGVTSLENSGVTLLGTEAALYLHDDLLYVLNAGGSYNSVSTDNLQILDPYDSESPFRTISQFSTGNGTNPQDVIVDESNAFISLSEPEADTDNVDEAGNPADIIVMDLATGDITNRLSFYDYLNNDGSRTANAYKMVAANGILYVILQDLDLNSYPDYVTVAGKIGMIDMSTMEVLGVITLNGRNPSAIALSTDNNYIFVASSNDYTYSTSYSGLEKVSLSTRTSVVTIHDALLEGYIEKLRVSESSVFAVVSKYNTDTFEFFSKLVTFPQDLNSVNDMSEFIAYGNDMRDIFVQNNVLWVSYRSISTSEGDGNPSIVAYDPVTAEQLGEALTPSAPGISISGQ